MKKVVRLMAMAGLMAAAVAQAGEAAPPMMMGGGDSPGAFVEHVDDRAGLDMNDAQKQQVRDLMEQQRAKHEAIRAETHERMKAILTPGQAAKLDAHHAQMKDVRENRRESREERRQEYRDKCEGKPGKKEKEKKRFWKREKTAE